MTPPFQVAPANIRINLILSESRIILLHSSSLTVLSVFIQIFVVGSERRTHFETQCVMALQGHPRSLILTPNRKRVCDFLSVINSNLSPIYLAPFQRYCRFPESATPPLFHPNFRGVPFGLDWRCCEDPKLIIRAINFELVPRICLR